MKREIFECHICKKDFKYNGIGKHYICSHNIKLSNEDVYIEFFNYNYPNFINNIINECNLEKKSVNVLLKEKYFNIGEGTINHLQRILKNKINVTTNDIQKLRTIKRQDTCIKKYGSIYSNEFNNNIGSFIDLNLASKASLIARNNPDTKTKRRNYINSEIFKEKRKKRLIEKYGTLIIKQSATSKWHLNIRKIFEANGIITKQEENIVGSYITDEFDENKNVCIELNGDFWHCNPNIFNSNYYHPIIKMTANEIWNKDNKKYEEYKKMGYDVFVIWESDDIMNKIVEYKKKYGY
jgi:G:T-mismatch repair DNA endonuclease (very short patch repair protein)